LLWLSLPAYLAACGIGGPCDHARGITLYATADGAAVEAVTQQNVPLSQMSFWEHQQDGRRELGWSILAPPLPGSATQVDILQGSADAGGGTLLYSFPIQNALTLNDSVVQVTSGTAAQFPEGSISFADFLQVLYREPVYLEVKTDSAPSGAFRSQLGTPPFYIPPADPADWQPLYCS